MRTIPCFACKTETVVEKFEDFSSVAQESKYSYAWAMADALSAGFACQACTKKVRKAMKILESILGPDFEIMRRDEDKRSGPTVTSMIWVDDDNISFIVDKSSLIKKMRSIYGLDWFQRDCDTKTGRIKIGKTRVWLKDGKYHRINGPAVKTPLLTAWLQEDQFHRTDGPALVYHDTGHEEWYIHGIRHRENGPAILYGDGYEEHYFLGYSHNINGPSIITPRENYYWYLFDNRFNKEEREKCLKEPILSFFYEIGVRNEYHLNELYDRVTKIFGHSDEFTEIKERILSAMALQSR